MNATSTTRGWTHSTRRQEPAPGESVISPNVSCSPTSPAICARLPNQTSSHGRQPPRRYPPLDRYWSRNPEGIPRPIREEHGLLIVEDIDVWLWGPSHSPKSLQDEFRTSSGKIFVPLGRWEELVDRAWVVPTTQALRSLPQDVFWEWPPGSLPKTSTTAIS